MVFIILICIGCFNILLVMDSTNNEQEEKVEVSVEIELDDKNIEAKRVAFERKKSVPTKKCIKNDDDDDDDILIKTDRSKSLDPSQFDAFNPIKTRITSIMSIMSLNDYGGQVIVDEPFKSTKAGLW